LLSQSLELDRIRPSAIHLRRGKDKARDAELLESVRRHGVLQPILVRTVPCHPGRYEVVAGHRRFAAAQGANLAAIPVTVRDLSDLEALELQVVENQQRADVHPLEEAEGYRLLTETHGQSVEEIALKVGKSRAYVYARLKLAALGKPARAAFLDGKIEASVALLIARIPAGLQEKALKQVLTGGEWDDDGRCRNPLSFRATAALVQRVYMLRLGDAPFDPKDAELVPAAGACEACPKRSGNQRELFGDVKDADVCTDTHCFHAKSEAASRARRAKLEAEGREVLVGAQAKRVFKYDGKTPAHGCGYRTLDDTEYLDNGGNAKVRSLLARYAPDAETVFCERPEDGVIVELARSADVERALAKAQPKKAKVRAADKAKDHAQRQRKERERALQNASILLVLEKSRAAKDSALWLFLGAHLADYIWSDTVKELLQRRGLEAKSVYQEGGKTLATWVGNDPVKARELVLDLVLTRGKGGYGAEGGALRAAVKLFKVTPEAVKRRANAEQVAAAERKKLKPAPAEALRQRSGKKPVRRAR